MRPEKEEGWQGAPRGLDVARHVLDFEHYLNVCWDHALVCASRSDRTRRHNFLRDFVWR